MSLNKPDRLIVNSPYKEPKHYWKYDRESRTFDKVDGRRPAGYLIASSDSKAFDDPGRFVEIPLVNRIRPRIAEWRQAGYPGTTSVTKRLLEHWNNPEERENKFFFCQLEAIETLIWLAEAPAADRVGIHMLSDGGSFQRLCSKLATGTGKTVVMAMLIAWQVINKATLPQDTRYSKSVFIVAPNLTVRNRLQVLNPGASDNYYEAFNIIPAGMIEKLRLGKVLIRNWHILQWETEEKLSKKKSVDKRGPKSDEAYVREILQDMSTARNILVINDEAHHAWRIAPGTQIKGLLKEDIEEATKWIGGLDRIQNARGILKCYDFSATPFVPSGKKASEEALFDWIVSDFGLNDAIESGLVKTPRVVIRDDTVPDTESYKSRLYHIYNDEEVKDDLNRKATPESPLPSLVVNAYHLLGADWLETFKAWAEAGHKVPPVMISVANRTETAARIKYSFDHHNVPIDDLCDPGATLHIDSKVLAMAESEDLGELGYEVDQEEDNGEETKKLTKKQQAELLRRQVDTVGQFGQDGGKIRNVISVGMLSEGWDAKTVTHIMGLRAFSSQLLCEQVVGRGLRRTAYEINSEGLFDPEHVNIFGVPFTFLPHEDTGDTLPPPPPPKTRIEPVIDKQEFEITFPNVIRIEHVFRPQLSLDMGAIDVLELDASKTIKLADLAPVVEGKPDIQTITNIDLEKLAQEYRLQRIMFRVTKDIFDQMNPTWKGSKENLLGQLFKLVDVFLKSDRIVINPPSYNQEPLKRRLILALNMTTVVNHIWGSIQDTNTTVLTPVFDQDHPIKSTGAMNPWYTGKPNEYTVKSHINYCVFDSTWESCEAFHLDCNNGVTAWVKNDHLGFEIYYVWQGVVRKYRPDFIVKLVNDLNLVLEVKGQETEQDKTKRRFMEDWVKAVNNHGGFGDWAFAVSRNPGDVEGIIRGFVV
jgi:type III restriction enzyme